MFKRGLIAAAAAASLVSAPALAQSSASKLSIASSARTGASAKGKDLFGASGVLIGVLVFAAVVGAVYAVAESSDAPNSP